MHKSVYVCVPDFCDYQVEWKFIKSCVRAILLTSSVIEYKVDELQGFWREEEVFSSKQEAQAECDRRNKKGEG